MSDNLPPSAGPRPIATDEAHVWKVRLDIDAGRLVSADEFQLDVPRRRFVITRAALRMLLGRYLDIPISSIAIRVDGNGKPCVSAEPNKPDLRFNVAHSGDLAVIAVTRSCEVGVDLEQLRPVRHAEQIARRYFHPAEINSIMTAPPTDRGNVFLRCWTAKEAVLKAIGTGITGSLADFSVPFERDEFAYVDVLTKAAGGIPTQCWLSRLEVDSEYAAAVAFVGSTRTIRNFHFERP
jgi:4'-phosphopantetheinyl transferase